MPVVVRRHDQMKLTAEIVFWVSTALLVYTYAGYPLLLVLWTRLRSRAVHPGIYEPDVSVLVVAHNEEERIGSKLSNLLDLDYPTEKLELVIASDGSSDDTVDIIRRTAGGRIKVVEFSEQRGKPSVINEVLPGLDGDIVVLFDVRQRIETDAIKSLLANFADPTVGAVGGELVLEPADNSMSSDRRQSEGVGEGVGFYWRYEKFIRSHESAIDSTIGVSGAIYAIRRSLFQAIPENCLLDDVLIPMQIVSRGYRVIFEPGARAYDILSTSAEEYRRKVRTIAGNFQLLFSKMWLLNPLRNRLWFQTICHKYLRLLGPLLLVLLLLSSVLLVDHWFYALALLLQLLAYTAAGTALLKRDRRPHNKFVNIAYAFCLLNWATVAGFWRYTFRTQNVTWKQSSSNSGRIHKSGGAT